MTCSGEFPDSAATSAMGTPLCSSRLAQVLRPTLESMAIVTFAAAAAETSAFLYRRENAAGSRQGCPPGAAAQRRLRTVTIFFRGRLLSCPCGSGNSTSHSRARASSIGRKSAGIGIAFLRGPVFKVSVSVSCSRRSSEKSSVKFRRCSVNSSKAAAGLRAVQGGWGKGGFFRVWRNGWLY